MTLEAGSFLTASWPQDALSAFRVLIASVLGAAVGWQRQHVGQEAGIRTFAAVALGACVFGLITPGDTRIGAQVVSGVGFLGAGVILRGREHVHGLTTAASLWSTASIGTAIAYGHYLTGSLVAIILFMLLSIPTKKRTPETAPAHRRPRNASSIDAGAATQSVPAAPSDAAPSGLKEIFINLQ